MAAGDTHSTHDDATTRDSVHAALAHASSAHSWHEANAHGLALAASGAWNDARVAFDGALDALASEAAPNVGTHEAMALVLGNLAHACFRSGSLDDAIRHGQRGCALRVALFGEDAVTVARARSDLAVMLAAAGRIEESPALLARAIAGIEQSAGDEDMRLAVVLENAARTALAAGQAANAEPHLIRLHALLGAHDLSTEPADRLVSRIMAARSDAVTASPIAAPTKIEAVPEQDTAALSQDDTDWEDQPLRDAVALTDVLLRTTPSGNVAVRAEADARDPWTTTPAESATSETAAETATTAETAAAAASLESVMKPVASSEPDIFGDTPLDLVELDVSGIDLVDDDAEHTRGRHDGHAAIDAAGAAAGDAPAPSGLGFVVEYGIPRDTASQPAVPERSYEPPGIRGSDAIAREALDQSSQFDPDGDQNVDLLTPPGASMSLGFGSDFELVPDTQHAPVPQATPERVESVATPMADASRAPGQVERRKTPRAVSVVMPSPAGGAPTMQSTMTDRDDSDVPAPPGASAPAAAQSGHAPRSPQRIATRLAKEPSGNGRAFAIGGSIAALAAAAAGWFLLRGNL